MNNFLRYFVNKTFFATMMSGFIIFVGLMVASQLKLQEFPDMEMPMTTIKVTAKNAAASDMESGAANRIEEELKSVSGLDEFISYSKEGSTTIRVFIDEQEDLDKVNDDIQSAVDNTTDIIDNEIPKVSPFTSGRFDVMSFGVYSETATESELQIYARELDKKLSKISSISTATINGLREREFIVELDQNKIRAYKLDFNTISSKISKRNIETSGGLLEVGDREKRILTYSKYKSVEELGDTIISILDNGSMLRLKDVATIKDSFEDKTSSSYVDNHLGFSVDVKKSTSADIRDTIQDVKDLLDSETHMFDGKFKYEYGMDLAKDMSERFNIVTTNGLVGLIFVIGILSLTLRKEISFWVSLSIPVCLLGVIIMLPYFGLALDSITLAALLLVIGIIVDDSVVVAESIAQKRQLGLSPTEASVQGVSDVFKPLIASLSTTCLVFVPMLYLTGPLGKMVYVIPIIVILALLFSLLDCMILLPAHINKLTAKEEKDNFKKLRITYEKFLNVFLKHKWKTIISSFLIMIAVSSIATQLKVDFFPTDDAKYLKVKVYSPSGTSIEDIEEFNKGVVEMVKEKTGDDLSSIIINNTQPTSNGLIELVNVSERETSAEEYAKMYRGFNKDGFRVVIRVDGGAGPPPGDPVEVRVISGNDDKRNEAIQNVVNYLESKSYIKDIETSEDVKDQQIRVKPNYEWIERYNYSVQELSNLLKFIFDGQVSTTVWLGDDEIDIRLSLQEKYKKLEYLKDTKIEMPNGDWIPIGQLVTVEEVEVVSELTHFDGERYVSITADIESDVETPTSVAEDLKLKFKDDLYVKYKLDGEAKKTSEAMQELIGAFLISIVGMYFILSLLLNSLIQPLLILIILPYAFAGSIGALAVHGSSLSFFGLIGLLGMFGVVVNNSLVLINKANELKASGMNKMDSIINAATSRLRPIILTSLTTIFCLLPLVYGVGGKDAFMSPMAMTLGYGLLLTVPIVLFVVPCYYLVMTRDEK